MDSKLTLKLDAEVIQRAKNLAAKRKISLSRMIESYLNSITNNEPGTAQEISPFVKSMATGKKVPADLDKQEIKEQYQKHLQLKHR